MNSNFWFVVGSQDLYGEKVLKTVAQRAEEMAFHTEALTPDIPSMQQELLDKHYLRKHGKNAYYGQG